MSVDNRHCVIEEQVEHPSPYQGCVETTHSSRYSQAYTIPPVEVVKHLSHYSPSESEGVEQQLAASDCQPDAGQTLLLYIVISMAWCRHSTVSSLV